MLKLRRCSSSTFKRQSITKTKTMTKQLKEQQFVKSSSPLKSNKFNKLTIKQERFCRLVAQSKISPTQAVKKVYNVGRHNPKTIHQTAISIAKENLNKPLIVNRIQALLNQNGLGLDNLTIKHSQLLDAKKPLIVDGELKETPDNGVQLDALKVAYKLQGVLNDSTPTEHKTLSISVQDTAQLGQVIEQLAILNKTMVLDNDNIGEIA